MQMGAVLEPAENRQRPLLPGYGKCFIAIIQVLDGGHGKCFMGSHSIGDAPIAVRRLGARYQEVFRNPN